MQPRSTRVMLGIALSAALESGASGAFAQAPPATPPPMPAPSLAPASAAPSRAGAALPPPPVPYVLPQVPPIAPGYVAPNIGLPSGDLVGLNQQPFVGIGLQDAIALALAKDPDLAIAQTNRRIAGYQIVAAEGAYDVRFQLQPSYTHSVVAPLSTFQSGPNGTAVTTDTLAGSTSLSGVTRANQRYSIGVSGSRVTTNNATTGFDPYYPTAISFNFTQPLARGTGSDDVRRSLQLARVNQQSNTDAALLGASNAVVAVTDTYWDLVAAWRNVGIQEEGLREANAQAQSNARLAQRGAVAPSDIVEANTQVNVFQDNVFSAIQNVQRLQTQLKSLIVADPADPVWLANLVPTSGVGGLPPEPKVDDLIIAALRNRAEVGQLRDARRQADVNLAYFRDQEKPQIDLQLGYTTNGLAGSPVSATNSPIAASLGAQVNAINALIANANRTLPSGQQIPPLAGNATTFPSYLNGGLGTSANNLFQNRFPTYGVSLNIGVPIRNRTAVGNYKATQEQARQLDVQQVQLIQRIKAESINAIATYRSAQYRLVSARAARAASESVYQSERRRFAAGASTTFLVLQRELDLANNRGRELQAQTDLNKAVVELQRVSGTIFAQNNIDVGTLGRGTLDVLGPNPLETATPAEGAPQPAAFGASPAHTPDPGTSGSSRALPTPAPGVLPPNLTPLKR